MTLILNTDTGPRDLGYLQIDQRAVSAPLPPGALRHFEADTYTCSHCEVVVVMNPARQRDRYKCRSCSHHVCDNCAAKIVVGERCLPFKAMIDQLREQAKGQAESPLIQLP